MKKRLLTMLTSAAVLLTSLIPLTVNAEETADTDFQLHEEYTFEEFIDLSDDEICALSDEIASIYTGQINCIPIFYELLTFRFFVYLDQLTEFTGGTDLAPLCRDLNLPENALVFIQQGDVSDETHYSARVGINWEVFTKYGDIEYIRIDQQFKDIMGCRLLTWMTQHPAVPNTPEFDVIAGGTVTRPFKGDIDSDDTVTISDASGTLGIYAKKAASLSTDEYTEDQLENADVDENGTVDLTDASAILSYYAKKGAGINTYWATVLTEIAPISE